MNDAALREHVLYLLGGGGAHLDFDKAVAGLPFEHCGAKATNIPHTPWRLLEHMRICQWDILEFSTNPEHISPDFPNGYWPHNDAPPDDPAWEKTLSRFRDDLEAIRQLVRAESTDLFAKIPHGDGQTILREALLVADQLCGVRLTPGQETSTSSLCAGASVRATATRRPLPTLRM